MKGPKKPCFEYVNVSSEKFDTLLDKSVTEIEDYSTNIVTQSTNLVGKKILITKITNNILRILITNVLLLSFNLQKLSG